MVPQTTMRLIFPHISRFISATFIPTMANVILWGSMVSLIGYNVVHTQLKSLSYVNDLLVVFTRPYVAAPHEYFAKKLWSAGMRENAKKELLLAAELNPSQPRNPSSQILGATTDPQDLLRTWENAPKREADEIIYWKKVVLNHPDYRDAYVQLAFLMYAQGNLIGTKTYLTQAAALDPNGKTVHDLLEFVTKQLAR